MADNGEVSAYFSRPNAPADYSQTNTVDLGNIVFYFGRRRHDLDNMLFVASPSSGCCAVHTCLKCFPENCGRKQALGRVMWRSELDDWLLSFQGEAA